MRNYFTFKHIIGKEQPIQSEFTFHNKCNLFDLSHISLSLRTTSICPMSGIHLQNCIFDWSHTEDIQWPYSFKTVNSEQVCFSNKRKYRRPDWPPIQKSIIFKLCRFSRTNWKPTTLSGMYRNVKKRLHTKMVCCR